MARGSALSGSRPGTTSRTALPLGTGRLRGIGPKQAILQRRAVKTADDGVHLLRIRRLDKREALGLLRFGIADHFNCVRDQVFGCQPSLDIVRGYPGGQIAQKHSEAHSAVVCISVRGGLLPGGFPGWHLHATTLDQARKWSNWSPAYFTTSEYGISRCTPPCANDRQGRCPATD
jgi:hypothetical protein